MRGVFLLLCVFIGEVFSPFLTYGGEVSLSERITREKRELEQMRRDISQRKREEQKTERRERSILSMLEEVDKQRERKRRDLSLVGLQVRKKEGEISLLREKEKHLRNQIGTHHMRIGKGVLLLHKERPPAEGIFYPARGEDSFLKRVTLLQRVLHAEASLLKDAEEETLRVKEFDRKITGMKNQLLSAKNELTRALEGLSLQRKRSGQLLLKVRVERGMTQKMITDLEEAAEGLTALVHKLELEKRREGGQFRFARAQGNLMWPVEGEVISSFGRQRHSVFDVEIFRKGIEIRSPMGEEIRAVHQGRVTYADWLKGYGMVMIIDHGDSYYSIYAHASRVFVEQKKAVEKGQVIGIVGGAGSSNQEGRLYFEIRHQGDPINPLVWLKKKD